MPKKKKSPPVQPMQPLEKDEHGVLRFKENKIVRTLLDVATARGIMDMNSIAGGSFSQEDREQFAQLIGYSLCGASDLSYVRASTLAKAEISFKAGITPEQAEIQFLRHLLSEIQKHLKSASVAAFGIHPDDLKERK